MLGEGRFHGYHQVCSQKGPKISNCEMFELHPSSRAKVGIYKTKGGLGEVSVLEVETYVQIRGALHCTCFSDIVIRAPSAHMRR